MLFDLFERYNVDYLLYSPIIDVRKEDGRVTGVVAGLKEGLTFFPARIVVDTTGDGDVAYLAGCEMEESEPGTGWRAPVTVAFEIGNVDCDKFYSWCSQTPQGSDH